MIGEANEKLSQERTTEISEGFGEKYNDRERENRRQREHCANKENPLSQDHKTQTILNVANMENTVIAVAPIADNWIPNNERLKKI